VIFESPSKLSQIESGVFAQCSSLLSIKLPDSVSHQSRSLFSLSESATDNDAFPFHYHAHLVRMIKARARRI
jgi:hypothetical protein